VTAADSAYAVGGIATPIIIALLLLVNRMHNGRVDAIDKRESQNNQRHLDNYKEVVEKMDAKHDAVLAEIKEERRAAENRDELIFSKLDKATETMTAYHTSTIANYVSKDDCGRCKEA